MSTSGEDFDLEDAQSGLEDALKAARAVVAALECAESCETEADFRANVWEAKDMAAELRGQLDDV